MRHDPAPAALLFLWLFFRSWHRVIADADMLGN